MTPDEAFGCWLSGFIDGEGNFDIHRQKRPSGVYFYCRFELALRADDRPILATCQARLGGKLYYGDAPKNGKGKPRVRWELVAREEVARLAALLERFPLQTKKAQDFEVWRAALAESMKTPGINRSDAMLPFWERLRALRRYAAAPGPLEFQEARTT